MTNEGKKLEPPLKLDMSFDEALRRFVRAKPKEVEESIERSKQKKPSDVSARGPGGAERRVSPSSRRRKPDDN
jgi:hypothetical protein